MRYGDNTFWQWVNRLTREEIVALLSTANCSIRETDKTDTLREVLITKVHDGTISPPEPK